MQGVMPKPTTAEDIQQLTIVVFTVLASANSDIVLKQETLSALLLLLRGDKRLFDAFRPTEDLLNKIKLGEMAMSRESP